MISGDIRVGWSIERCQGGCSASSSSFYTIPSHPHHHHLDKHHYHHHHHDEEEYHESMLSWTREASCRPIVLLAPAAGSCFNKNLHLWKFYLTKLWQHRNECQCSFPPRGAAYFDIRKKLGLAQPRGEGSPHPQPVRMNPHPPAFSKDLKWGIDAPSFRSLMRWSSTSFWRLLSQLSRLVLHICHTKLQEEFPISAFISAFLMRNYFN